MVAAGFAAAGHGDARDGGNKVLAQKGHAGKRALRDGARGCRSGHIIHAVNDRVDLRVDAVDAQDRFLAQFHGRDFLFSDQFGQPQAIVFFIVGKTRHVFLLCSFEKNKKVM